MTKKRSAPLSPSPTTPRTEDDPLVDFCRGLAGSTEDIKWGNNLVFSVSGKMFAVFQVPDIYPFGFKVDPLIFSSLVGQHGIVPAPYLARHHWISITDRDCLPLDTLKDFLEESYRLTAMKLPKKIQRALGLLED